MTFTDDLCWFILNNYAVLPTYLWMANNFFIRVPSSNLNLILIFMILRPKIRIFKLFYSTEFWTNEISRLSFEDQQLKTQAYYKQRGFLATKIYLSKFKSLSNQVQLANLYLRHGQIDSFFKTFKFIRKTWFPVTSEIHLLLLQTCLVSLIKQARSSDTLVYDDNVSLHFTRVITQLQRHLYMTTQNYTNHTDYPNFNEMVCIVYCQINLVPKAIRVYEHYLNQARPSPDCLDFLIQKLSLTHSNFKIKMKVETGLEIENVDVFIQDVFDKFGDRRPTLRAYVCMIRYFTAYRRDPAKALEYYHRGCVDYGVDKLWHAKEFFIDGIQGRGMEVDKKWRDRWIMWDKFVERRPAWSLVKDDVVDEIDWGEVNFLPKKSVEKP